MDQTILGAIIGAAAAIIINGIIFILSRRNEINRDKIQVISEIISSLYSQLRYSNRFIGHQIWLNYYDRTLRLIIEPELHQIANNKIEFRINLIEQIEARFINSDSQLAILTAKYRSLYPKEKKIIKSIKEITEYVISDHVEFEDFEDWSDQLFKDPLISNKITDVEIKTLEKLETSFEPLVSNLIDYLEKKIK